MELLQLERGPRADRHRPQLQLGIKLRAAGAADPKARLSDFKSLHKPARWLRPPPRVGGDARPLEAEAQPK
ncbi:MAG: hypothetical protein WD690_01365 [Vicinamibacterales bacterium]